MDGLGFSPRRQSPDEGETTQVHLHTCPFLELVGQNPDAMCGLHLGVVRGILEHEGDSGESVVLEPFGAPAACVVRLSAPARPAAGGRSS